MEERGRQEQVREETFATRGKIDERERSDEKKKKEQLLRVKEYLEESGEFCD